MEDLMEKNRNDLIGALMEKALENIGDEDLRQSLVDEARIKLEQPVKIGMSPGGDYRSDVAVMIPGYIAVIWNSIQKEISDKMRDELGKAVPAAAQAAVKSIMQSDETMTEIKKRIGDEALSAIAKETANRLGDTIGNQVGFAMASAIEQALTNMQLR
jgi:hypothetical protein